MKIKLITVVSVLVFCVSCGNKAENTVIKLNDEVMAIHDEVMPKMTEIHTLRKKLRLLENAQVDSTIIFAITNLSEADDAMMEWMSAYKKPKDNSKTALAYLSNEKMLITEVKVKMLESIQDAHKILRNDQ